MKKNGIFLLPFLLFGLFSQAQQAPQKVRESTWARISANDTTVNFFDAQKDFEKFYTKYLKEKNREELHRARREPASPQEEHLDGPEELLVSNYIKWSIAIKPFVNADGTIIPLEKRLAIIRQARQSTKAID